MQTSALRGMEIESRTGSHSMSPGWCQLSVMTTAFMPLEDVPTANLVETQPQSLTSSLIISSYHMQLQWRDIAKSIRFGLVHTSHDSVIQHITMIDICFLLCSLYSGRSERQNWHSFGFRLVRALYTLSKWRSCGPESQGFPPWMVTMQPIPIEYILSKWPIDLFLCLQVSSPSNIWILSKINSRNCQGQAS